MSLQHEKERGMDKRLAVGLVAVLLIAGVVAVVLITDDETPDAPETVAPPEEGDDDPGPEEDEAPPEPEDPEPDEPQPEVETVAEGFDEPWGLAFVEEEGLLLMTQLAGTLTLVDTADGSVTEIDGAPEVHTQGQGGLLDIAVHPDYPEQHWIYLTYAGGGEGGTATHLARAQLDLDDATLDSLEELFVAEPFLNSTQHYGSRVEFAADGHLRVTFGDRGDKDFDDHPSQDTSTTHGTTIRLSDDGSVPDDNPFVDNPDVHDAIYSYGHRNPQGMTVHPETEELWQSDHGEEDGDELVIVEAGGNHGWPIAHTGCEYGTDAPVGASYEEVDDVVAPVLAWECTSGGFPPAGMTFVTGEEFATWEGDLLVGNLAGEYLGRFTVDDRDVEEVEPLLADEGWRIRDVAIGPHDGAIYVAIDDTDVPLVRLVDGAGG